MRFRAVAALVLCASAAGQEFESWEQAGFEKARVRTVADEEIYPDGTPASEYTLAMTVVILDGANWTEARALRHLRKTADIYAACGISLRGVRLARGRGPRGRHDIDVATPYPGSEMPVDVVDLARRVPFPEPFPRVFLVGKLEGDETPARAFQQGAVSDEEARRFAYMNTAWIAYKAHWEEKREEEYSAVAHEVAHVLCRCGHSEGPQRHLLHAKRNFLGVKILESDCLRMRSSPLLKPSPGPAKNPTTP